MDRVSFFFDGLFERRRWLLHIVFWCGVLGFYVAFFGRKQSNYSQTFFFVGLLMPITIATTYLLNYYLVPHYLMRERYLKFLLYTFYVILGSVFLEMTVALLTFLVIAGLRIHAMSPASFDLVFILSSLLLVAFLGVAIKMVLHWRQSREDYQKLMRDKVETELKFLKTQLHPHFLFNTLNNLYYLANEKSDKAPQAILALSEILDYVMNAGKTRFVPLAQEWQQVQNFVSLEMLRYDDRVSIDMHTEGDLETALIAPMMMVTLTENAFKHGVMPSAGASWIRLQLRANENMVSIKVENSNRRSPQGRGVGLTNLRNQLELLYPGHHELLIENVDEKFCVELTLTTSK